MFIEDMVDSRIMSSVGSDYRLSGDEAAMAHRGGIGGLRAKQKISRDAGLYGQKKL